MLTRSAAGRPQRCLPSFSTWQTLFLRYKLRNCRNVYTAVLSMETRDKVMQGVRNRGRVEPHIDVLAWWTGCVSDLQHHAGFPKPHTYSSDCRSHRRSGVHREVQRRWTQTVINRWLHLIRRGHTNGYIWRAILHAHTDKDSIWYLMLRVMSTTTSSTPGSVLHNISWNTERRTFLKWRRLLSPRMH